MTSERSQLITVGRIGGVYGVRGWLRINSFTNPPEQILHYQPWYLLRSGAGKSVGRPEPLEPEHLEVEEIRPHAEKWVAKFKGIDDREQAQLLVQSEIQVDAAALPELASGEYYWHQLQDLEVVCEFDGRRTVVGRIHRLMETGANDVMVVRASQDSVDRRERLIPYLPGRVVKEVDLAAGQIIVDWDPQF